jgi:hypothetical protein
MLVFQLLIALIKTQYFYFDMFRLFRIAILREYHYTKEIHAATQTAVYGKG